MRLSRLVVIPVLAALAAGCGGGSGSGSQTLSPAQAVRAAATSTAQQKSARLQLTSVATIGAQKITINGSGLFDLANRTGTMSIEVPGATGGAIEERIVGGNVYIALPNAKSTFYVLKMSDLVGTSFAASTDPAAGLQALQGVSSDVRKVGAEKVRDASTTHYKGTYDVQKALAKLTGPAKDALSRTLTGNDLSAVPFDAYIDGSGRLRKFVQQLDVTQAGRKIVSTTTLELYDFGAKVDVTAPPASQVKSGKPLLDALKGAGRTAG